MIEMKALKFYLAAADDDADVDVDDVDDDDDDDDAMHCDSSQKVTG
jgi:hypothetical protein